MNRSSSAPSPLVQASRSATSSTKDVAGRRLPASSGRLGRAGGKVILPTSVGGCYLLGGQTPAQRARLPHFAPRELWGRHSSKHIVQDLYASYAADPLAPGPRKTIIASSASSSTAGTPRHEEALEATGPPSERPCFLERYVRQQARIEQLLNEWKPPIVEVEADVGDDPSGDLDQTFLTGGVEEDAAGEPVQACDSFPASGSESSLPLQVAAQTRNVVFDGDVMTCSMNCGGARFTPPSEGSFRFCVRHLDNPETHPIFIGMVPAGHPFEGLTEVNFFDRKEGIFLRVGGFPPGREAIDGPPLDERNPLKPEFQVFGERSSAELPMPRPNSGVALHFFEAFPRKQIITEQIQCKGCKLLLDSTELFAEHCFDEDTPGHGDDFGFDSCRRVEIVEEGDYNFDPRLAQRHVRFQVENARPTSKGQTRRPDKKAFSAEPCAKSLRNGVPSLPREYEELVGGRPDFGPPGPWLLCVLLAIPGTRVEIRWLAAERPLEPPKPTEIRAAAKPKASMP